MTKFINLLPVRESHKRWLSPQSEKICVSKKTLKLNQEPGKCRYQPSFLHIDQESYLQTTLSNLLKDVICALSSVFWAGIHDLVIYLSLWHCYSCSDPNITYWFPNLALVVSIHSFVMGSLSGMITCMCCVSPGNFLYTRVTVHLEERKQIFWDRLDTSSELVLIPGDLKKDCSPQVSIGTYGVQVNN